MIKEPDGFSGMDPQGLGKKIQDLREAGRSDGGSALRVERPEHRAPGSHRSAAASPRSDRRAVTIRSRVCA